MDKYTIYCTEAQTKKALELGAPIKGIGKTQNLCFNCFHFISRTTIDGNWYWTPTAEQMIGFFRSKNIHIVIHKDVVDKWSAYGHEIEPIEFTIFDRLTGYNSFEEATLAAIDAALEFLISNKK